MNLNNDKFIKERFYKVAYYITKSKKSIIIFKEEKELLNFVLKNYSWTYIEKFKKHFSVDHCRDMIKYHSMYQKKWKNISGIYKITYLSNKLFSFYGSSKNVGARLKYHYYLGKMGNTFLGLFLNTFG